MSYTATDSADSIMAKHFINCDVNPSIPENWAVVEHRKGGMLEWDPKKVALYLSERQKVDSVRGRELYKELKSQRAMNACVLDYLLAYPKLIPSKWKGKAVFFWGTIYRCYSGGGLCIRCLRWGSEEWGWGYVSWLAHDFRAHDPAAVLARLVLCA